MTTRLEVNNTRHSMSSGPVLSPKIIKSFASKLVRNGHHSEQDLAMALGLYMQGVVPSRSLAWEAANQLHYPVVVGAAHLRSGEVLDADWARRCTARFSALSHGKYRVMDMGGARLCLVLEDGADKDEACAMLKKAARDLGGVINIGLSEQVASSQQLPSAFSEAEQVARLGIQLWGKPYIYRYSDIGLTLGLIGSEAVRNHVAQESQRILAVLARPKVLLPTLKLFFASNMSLTEVARLGKVHRNTVVYRLDKIHQLSGLDPLDFNDATQLYLASTMKFITKPDVTAADARPGEYGRLADKAIISLLNGSGLGEAQVRALLGAAGLILPADFSIYLVAREGDIDSVGLNTTFIAQIMLRPGQWLLIGAHSARQTARVAAGLAHVGMVTYATSTQLGSQLGSAIPIMVSSQGTTAQCWPDRTVVDLDSHVGILAFAPDARARKYAYMHAKAIVDKLRLARQLETTAGVLLDTSLNLTLAARRLKIHRNTLIYRVGRIRHLTGYDLTRFEDAVQMRLAFLLT